jgi:hypothetical protein
LVTVLQNIVPCRKFTTEEDYWLRSLAHSQPDSAPMSRSLQKFRSGLHYHRTMDARKGSQNQEEAL